jgi:hypothetical protein
MSKSPMRRRAATTRANVRRDRGSTLVEFAVSLPLLALVTMASMAVMRIVQAQFGVQAAAREAAMVGSQVNTLIDPYSAATSAALTEAERIIDEYGLDSTQATITFDNNDPIVRRDTYFQVQIEYPVDIIDSTVSFFSKVVGVETHTFVVHAISVAPIQKHKARWPCPSPDPICS